MDRDISWLQFNNRVADEIDKDIPLEEKVSFVGIVNSNLDEFMQVRYPSAVETYSDDTIQRFKSELIAHTHRLEDSYRKLNDKHRFIRKIKNLDKAEVEWCEKLFIHNIFPILQPVTLSVSFNPKPGMYILVNTKLNGTVSTNTIEIPGNVNRFIQVMNNPYCIDLIDLICSNLRTLYNKCRIVSHCPFSILRSAEVYIKNTDDDPFNMIKKTLLERSRSWITRIEIGTTDNAMIKLVKSIVPIQLGTIILSGRYIGMQSLKSIPNSIYTGNQRRRIFTPVNTLQVTSMFDAIRQSDVLLYHPFESYSTSVVRFIKEASVDTDVKSIKIALYRVSEHSEIIDALLQAAANRISVTVLIELKARFDEYHNMEISKILEEGGVRLVYTNPSMKTHAKLCVVSRMEKKGLRIYAHVGTGNYSEANAKVYTDYSYFTSDRQTCNDLTRFFNLLTTEQGTFKSKKIVYAPYNMRAVIGKHIDKQIKLAKKGKPSGIVFKCNAFTDDKLADKIISAANVGVPVTLIVRGACIIGSRKNINVYSIVGRFLEHSRVYIFGTGKRSKVYMGSNDIMHRNLSLRNELMVLLTDDSIVTRIKKHIKLLCKDTVNRRIIHDNYGYNDITDTKRVSNAHDILCKEARKLV